MTSLSILRKEPIFFYTDVPIVPYGQGSSMRVFTNLRAYADLGFKVKVVFAGNEDAYHQSLKHLSSFGELAYFPTVPEKPSLAKRLAFYLGFPKASVLDVLFTIRPSFQKILRAHMNHHPDAIHHFEYDHFASAVVGVKGVKAIWSNHDILSERLPLLRKMRREYLDLSGRDLSRETRLKRIRQAEDEIAQHCNLILNIAQHEWIEFRQNRNYANAELFPMSWPDEDAPKRQRGWMAGGVLRMLHLGSVDGFVGYDSLRFILGEVFPLLPDDNLKSLELLIVGRMGETPYAQRIQELAAKYPQVKFLGFLDDIKRVYAEVDLQLVGGYRASGLRTRIIESMVYGVPVLSTNEMAKGLQSLVDGENILLAEDASDFAQKMIHILSGPQELRYISEEGQQTYSRLYSRKVASEKLKIYLEKYF